MMEPTFLDLQTIWQNCQNHPPKDRLRIFFKNSGVTFYDEECNFVQHPSVAIVGVGGIPIQRINERPHLLGQPITVEQLRKNFTDMMGFCGFMSYLNPKNQTPAKMSEIMLKHGHFSTGHALYLNIAVMGFSCAVENELNCQRDIIHLSRVTVARTIAQNNPPIVVLDPKALPLFRQVYQQTQQLLTEQKRNDECLNNLFPAAKATMTILSASLRNFQKLVSAQDDQGKEIEFRNILKKIHLCLHPIFPEIFPI